VPLKAHGMVPNGFAVTNDEQGGDGCGHSNDSLYKGGSPIFPGC
jgi:hypothetical protein